MDTIIDFLNGQVKNHWSLCFIPDELHVKSPISARNTRKYKNLLTVYQPEPNAGRQMSNSVKKYKFSLHQPTPLTLTVSLMAEVSDRVLNAPVQPAIDIVRRQAPKFACLLVNYDSAKDTRLLGMEDNFLHSLDELSGAWPSRDQSVSYSVNDMGTVSRTPIE